MKCDKCNQGMVEGKTLHRQNEKGVTGIWRCEECMTPAELSALDPVTKRLTDIISGKDR